MYGSDRELGGLEADEPYELLNPDVILLLLRARNGDGGVEPDGTIEVPLLVTRNPSSADGFFKL